MYFKDRAQNSKTVYCISCSIVCKIFFAQNSPIFQLRLAESQEEHRQLQSILRFMQTQKNSVMVVVITLEQHQMIEIERDVSCFTFVILLIFNVALFNFQIFYLVLECKQNIQSNFRYSFLCRQGVSLSSSKKVTFHFIVVLHPIFERDVALADVADINILILGTEIWEYLI